jgi:hypothetical protein
MYGSARALPTLGPPGGSEPPIPCKSVTKERDVFTVEFRQLLKFDEIDPSFSEFAFREKRTRFAKSFSDFDLCQTGIAARLDQASEELLICPVVALIVDIHTRMYIQFLTDSPK